MDAESLAQIQQTVTTAITATETRLRDEIRQTGILVENVQHNLELVVEGMQFHRQRFTDLELKIEHESRETRALLQLSYHQLHQRVENLEQRVHVIEQRLGIPA